MIVYSQLGTKGRLGNQLFQIASTIGIAIKHGHDFAFPTWAYNQYFKNPLPGTGKFDGFRIEEKHFHYDPSGFDGEDNYDVSGWRQSEQYWEDSVGAVRAQLRFKDSFVKQVRAMYAEAFKKPVIAISVRRGDFVDNPNYAQVSALYYVSALIKHFPNFLEENNVMVFSDDIEYCRIHFEGLPNVYFAGGADIEQLCLMSMASHYIISNSTFSWWGAYLGEKPTTKVIRPRFNFAGQLRTQNSESTYWPRRWTIHDPEKLDLMDVTFTIPVFIDHPHRRKNLHLCVCMLQRDLETNVIVGEQGGQTAKFIAKNARYHEFKGMTVFHRTKMLNDMARMAGTLIVVNWDCDVFVSPLQLWVAAQAARSGTDMVYPYDGRFARVPREPWFRQVEHYLDLGIFRDTEFGGKNGKPLPTSSVGGAIMFRHDSFFAAGGENEKFISFGPEDWERYYRFETLGYQIKRIPGALYHIDHWCGPNSSSRNPYFKRNHTLLDQLRTLDKGQLLEEIRTWPWRR